MSDHLNEPKNKLGKNDPRQYKLGKAPSKIDARTFKFAPLLHAPRPEPPKAWSFDKEHPGVPTPMFKNGEFGDCVIAGRAHHTLRFELIEQGLLLPITDKEVTDEYFAQTGGGDTGLIVLDSLKLWRNRGWIVAGRNYKIDSFASIDWRNRAELMWAMVANVGVQIGASLPVDAANQIRNGEDWVVTSGPDSTPGGWGGHLFIVEEYDEKGLTAITWGARQRLSWDWLAKYCDECYAIFDGNDGFDPNIVTPPVRPQTDEHHDNPSQPGADVAVGVKVGWGRQEVQAYFEGLSARFMDERQQEAQLVENWKLGKDAYHVYYNAATELVDGVTRTMNLYNA